VAKVPTVAAARSLAGRHLIRSPPVTRSETADPGLFRPWRDDRRPVWEVTARWTSPIRNSDDDLSYLADTLTATGMARAPRLAAGDGWQPATAGCRRRCTSRPADRRRPSWSPSASSRSPIEPPDLARWEAPSLEESSGHACDGSLRERWRLP